MEIIKSIRCGFYRIGLCLLLFLLTSTAAFAVHHFQGGYFTYKYLGNGKYEFLIKGYWQEVVTMLYPRYSYQPSLTFPVTVAKTLLPDNKTVEHVEMQTVAWRQPGQYIVYYNPCCMGTGANYNGNPIDVNTMVNFNPDMPSSGPMFYDFPLFHFQAGRPVVYHIDAKDPDGHDIEYSLQIPNGLTEDVYRQMVETGFQLTSDGTILWDTPVEGTWLVRIRASEKVDGSLTGAYTERLLLITISPDDGNQLPKFTPQTDHVVKDGGTISFEVEAFDAGGQGVVLGAYGEPMENGATFNQTEYGSTAKGIFSWTPPVGALGSYRLHFIAADNHTSPGFGRMDVNITVAACGEISLTYTVDKQPCPGSESGEISLLASGGHGPYRFSIDSGLTFKDIPGFVSLAAGNYAGIVEDAMGCRSGSVAFTLEEALLPEVSLTLPASLCNNDDPLALTGGTPSGGIYSGVGIENGFFSPSSAGTGSHSISYTYTDANGCANAASQTVTIKDSPQAYAGEDATVYSGSGSDIRSCTDLSGIVSGGLYPYTVSWNTGETAQSIYVCPADTTTYAFTATDAAGCADTSYVTVFVQPAGSGNGYAPEDPGPPETPGPPDGAGKPDSTGSGSGAGRRPGETAASAGARTIAPSGQSLAATSIEFSGMPEGLSVYPNPITDVSELTFRLEKAETVLVEIVDFTGKVVKQLYNDRLQAGQVLRLPVNAGVVGKGVYIARVLTSENMYTVKLIAP